MYFKKDINLSRTVRFSVYSFVQQLNSKMGGASIILKIQVNLEKLIPYHLNITLKLSIIYIYIYIYIYI